MKSLCNENKTDRIIRVIIGVVFIAAGLFVTTGTISTVLFVLGGIALFTAVTGFCLLYKVMGISTCKIEPEETDAE